MTDAEFSIKYHNFETEDVESAKDERDKVTAQGVDAVVVGPLMGRYCLMLRGVAEMMATVDPSIKVA